jgi:CarD family transcriptional regulator
MFKKGEKVVYPKHGAGKIVEVYKEKVGSKEKQYYRIQFLNSSTTVSVPKDNAKGLGLRHPLSKSRLRDTVRRLGKKVKITRNTLVTLDSVSKEKLNSGKAEDVVELVNLLKSLAKKKEEENKNFSYSYSDRLEVALDFIRSEVALVLGENVAKRI